MKYKLSVKKPNTVVLLMLISYATVSAVLIAPGIPRMREFFGASSSSIQFAVVTFLFSYAGGQLFYGILANRFRRKKTIYCGLAVGVLGSILCVMSGVLHSFELLLLGRFIEALGAGAGLALTFIIINDYFYHAQAVKVTAWAAIAFAVSPGVSTTIGGVIVTYLGWVYCFWFLAFYGLLIMALCAKLPETSTAREGVSFNVFKLYGSYKAAFMNKRLVSFSILLGSTSAILYVFLSVTPVIVINSLGIRPDTYGMLNLILTCGLILGNIVVLRISDRIKSIALVKSGAAVMSVGITSFLAFFLAKEISVYSIFLTGFVIFLGIALLYSSAATIATSGVHDKAVAAASMSFINAGTACFGIMLVSVIPVVPVLNMAIVLSFFLLVMLVSCFSGKSALIDDLHIEFTGLK